MNRSFPPRRSRSGFTFIELWICVGIIALVIFLLLPALQSSRASSISAACVANLRQIGVAHAAYAGDHHGAMIPCGTPIRGSTKNTYRWYNVLEPYLGKATDPSSPVRPKWQRCGAKKLNYESMYDVGYGWNFQSFGLYEPGVVTPGNPGALTWFPGSRYASVQAPAETIVIGDSHDAEAPFDDWQNFLLYWGGTANDAKLPRRHRGGGNFLMVDGSVRTMTFAEVTANNYYYLRRK